MNLPVMLDSCAILLATGGPWLGKAAFIGVFALLLVWLIFLPDRLIAEKPGLPWWRRSRVWAIALTCIQMAVYAWLG